LDGTIGTGANKGSDMREFFRTVSLIFAMQSLFALPLLAVGWPCAPSADTKRVLGSMAVANKMATPVGDAIGPSSTVGRLAEAARAGADLGKIMPKITKEDPLAKYPRVIRPEEIKARRCMMLMENMWQLDRALEAMREAKVEAMPTRQMQLDGCEVDLPKLVDHSRRLAQLLDVGHDVDWDGLAKTFSDDTVSTRAIPYLNVVTFSNNLQKIINQLPSINALIGTNIPAPTPQTYTLIGQAEIENGGSGDYTISSPGGVYRLKENVTWGTTNVITVTGDDVVIDLAGHTIDGNGGNFFGVFFDSGNYCCIKNGTLRNFGNHYYAVSQELTPGVALRIQDLYMVDNSYKGAWIRALGLVQRCYFSKNDSGGLDCAERQVVVKDSIAINNMGSGMFFGTDNAHVMKNCYSTGNDNGFYVQSDGWGSTLIYACVALNNTSNGFYTDYIPVLAGAYARGNGSNFTGSFVLNSSSDPTTAQFWDCLDL